MLRLFIGIAAVPIIFWSSLQVDASFVGPQQILVSTARSAPTRALGYQESSRRRSLVVVQAGREAEIRRKIAQLKEEGRIKNNPSVPQDDGTRKSATPVAEQYGNQLRNKLGSKKAKLMGTTIAGTSNTEDEEDPIIAELDEEEEEEVTTGRTAQLGSLTKQEEETASNYVSPTASSPTSYKNFDASLFEDDDDEEEELSEEDLVDLVAAKMAEKRKREHQEKEQRIEELKKEREELKLEEQAMISSGDGKTTSGIGGRWVKNNETAAEEYKPSSSGTWGVFERPKDISRAFGGGKRVGAGYTPDNLNKKKAEEDTRARLQQYREKVGIDVQSEKDHADEIETALAIGRRAMEVRTPCIQVVRCVDR